MDLPLPLPLPSLLPSPRRPRPPKAPSSADAGAIVVRAAPSQGPPCDKITVVEIHRRMDARRARRSESYEKVLAICMRRVALASSRDAMRLLCEVPEFVVGVPPYDVRRCTAHIMTSLRDAGFVVRYYHPRTLYVSWDPSEMNESPRRAQAPEAPQTRVTFAALGVQRQPDGRVVLDLS